MNKLNLERLQDDLLSRELEDPFSVRGFTIKTKKMNKPGKFDEVSEFRINFSQRHKKNN